MRTALRRTFASLDVPNYRRYFAGQVVSISGNWMHNVAELWLVVSLTGSGVSVGLAAGLQFAPVLLFGIYGGLLADRFDKLRMLKLTALLAVLPPFVLFLLAALGSVEVWMVYVLVFARGTVLALDNPARLSFVHEMVGEHLVVNAVNLANVTVHGSRIIGPMLAGAVIALIGVDICFLANALSFLAMYVALTRVDVDALHRSTIAPRAKRQVRAALKEVRQRPELRIPLMMMAVIGMFTFNFQVVFPLLAAFTWEGTATTFALLGVAMGLGAVTGAIAAGAYNSAGPGLLVGSAAVFGVALVGASAAPSLEIQLVALLPVGAASVVFAAGVNSALQLSAGPHLRGRVMALYSVVFLGSTPFGAPLIGWLAEVAGPRGGLLVGGAAALVAAVWAAWAYGRAGHGIRSTRGLRRSPGHGAGRARVVDSEPADP